MISSFVQEIFKFSYYANLVTDDVTGCASYSGKTREEGDWNRACCHSNTKICTIRYISWGTTSLPSFNRIAPLLAEVFLILCLTTVLAKPVTSGLLNST